MKQATDTEKYKFKILNCFLYVPIAQLSSTTFSEIERVLTSKSVAIHYRKIEIRNISLVAGKEEYNSESLFASDCPCRIVICFLESKKKTGSPLLNPFDFRRSWTVTVSSNADEVQVSQREKYLEEKLLDFEKQLAFFKSCVTLASIDETTTQTSTKGKGRGKRSDQTQQQPQPPSQSSFFDRFRTSFSGPSGANADSQSVHSEQQSTSHQSQHSGNDPPSYADATATTKTVYIKQVDLLLNGAPLDQLDTRETGK